MGSRLPDLLHSLQIRLVVHHWHNTCVSLSNPLPMLSFIRLSALTVLFLSSVGDVIEILMAMSLVNAAASIDGGLPLMLRAKMISNIIWDFGIGFIPILGDIGDMFFRANTRNAWLLDAYLTEKAKAIREGTVRDPDSGSPHRVAAGELNKDTPTGHPMRQHQGPAQPAPARTGGYLMSGRGRQPDLETGLVDIDPSSGNGGGGQVHGKKKSRR